jgi:hypothetical protein
MPAAWKRAATPAGVAGKLSAASRKRGSAASNFASSVWNVPGLRDGHRAAGFGGDRRDDRRLVHGEGRGKRRVGAVVLRLPPPRVAPSQQEHRDDHQRDHRDVAAARLDDRPHARDLPREFVLLELVSFSALHGPLDFRFHAGFGDSLARRCRPSRCRASAGASRLPRLAARPKLGEAERRLARPAGLEPATPGLGNRCSILLSYGRENSHSTP